MGVDCSPSPVPSDIHCEHILFFVPSPLVSYDVGGTIDATMPVIQLIYLFIYSIVFLYCIQRSVVVFWLLYFVPLLSS